MKYLLLGILVCLSALATEKQAKQEPITVQIPRPAFVIKPNGDVTFEKGVEPEEVVRLMFAQINELSQKLQACENPKSVSPKKKVKDGEHN